MNPPMNHHTPQRHCNVINLNLRKFLSCCKSQVRETSLSLKLYQNKSTVAGLLCLFRIQEFKLTSQHGAIVVISDDSGQVVGGAGVLSICKMRHIKCLEAYIHTKKTVCWGCCCH